MSLIIWKFQNYTNRFTFSWLSLFPVICFEPTIGIANITSVSVILLTVFCNSVVLLTILAMRSFCQTLLETTKQFQNSWTSERHIKFCSFCLTSEKKLETICQLSLYNRSKVLQDFLYYFKPALRPSRFARAWEDIWRNVHVIICRRLYHSCLHFVPSVTRGPFIPGCCYRILVPDRHHLWVKRAGSQTCFYLV